MHKIAIACVLFIGNFIPGGYPFPGTARQSCAVDSCLSPRLFLQKTGVEYRVSGSDDAWRGGNLKPDVKKLLAGILAEERRALIKKFPHENKRGEKSAMIFEDRSGDICVVRFIVKKVGKQELKCRLYRYDESSKEEKLERSLICSLSKADIPKHAGFPYGQEYSPTAFLTNFVISSAARGHDKKIPPEEKMIEDGKDSILLWVAIEIARSLKQKYFIIQDEEQMNQRKYMAVANFESRLFDQLVLDLTDKKTRVSLDEVVRGKDIKIIELRSPLQLEDVSVSANPDSPIKRKKPQGKSDRLIGRAI